MWPICAFLYYPLTISAQSLTTCTNVMAATRNFVASSSIVCIAWCDNKFVLPASPIAENLQRYDRALYITCKGKEVPHSCSYNDEWFLDSGASAHFTLFKSDFVSMTQENYSCITNFIQPYLHQFFNDSHSLNSTQKPLKRPFDLY